MTKGRITLLSTIITLLLSRLNAQTGEGCYGRLRACPPGQVRLNAQISASGAFQGGCTCGCPPSLADPQSANYCNAPRTVNFDPVSTQGNCQCTCPPDVTPLTCQGRQLWHEAKCACECPSWMPAQSDLDCTAPQVFLPEMCQCGCPQGSIFGPCTAEINGATTLIPGSVVTEQCTCDTSGVICSEPAHSPDPVTGVCSCPAGGSAAPGGGFYPNCELPQIQDPITCDCVTTTTTAPPFGAPQVANCESVGACDGCPAGTTGTCTINCDVGNDACKDGEIRCNNNNADCIVNCMTGSACAGAAKIFGPTGTGSLFVNCIGGQSCEGAVSMDATAATKQLIVDCQGSQSCKGALKLSFPALGGKLTCAGAPDSCQGMGAGSFVLPAGIEATPLASFECVGQYCPPAAPANFNNVPIGLRPPPAGPNNPAPPIPPFTPQQPQVPFLPPPGIPTPPVIVPGPNPPPLNPVNPQPPVPQQPQLPTPAPILILPPGVTPPNIPGMPPIPFIHSGDIPPGGLPVNPSPPNQIPPNQIPPPRPPVTPVPPTNPINPNPPPLIPPANPVPPTNPQQPGTGILPPGIPPPPPMPIWMPPMNNIPANPVAPGTGGSTGGTLIINTNQPIPIVRPDEEVICEGQGGECSCSGTRSCTIKCEGQDACKEKIISCPRGHDCTLVCSGSASCISSTVNAPVGKDFVANCAGTSSCADTTFNAVEARNVAYTCSVKDACKGATSLNCGSGMCEVACSGEASCDSAAIKTNRAISFACLGAAHCPAQYTSPPVPIPTIQPTSPCNGYSCTCNNALQCFSNPEPTEGCNCVCPDNILQQAMLSDPALICGVSNGAQEFDPRTCGCDCPASVNRNCIPTQVFNQNKCQCECPGGNECPGGSIMNSETCNCECPSPRLSPADCGALGRVLRNCQCACQQECAGPGQIQDLRTCGCACPAGTPIPSQCPSGVVDELQCQCAPEIQSPYCCHPRIDGMTMWNGDVLEDKVKLNVWQNQCNDVNGKDHL
eukprot:CAMPEP_0201567214 /NCGR_PEP_ID=MMETSP0190_2-20130828/7599_1 /ASSEMBLY_ACC=CAM_ASM_000263 /TAXON_ID=37353 /ORGANISM="Rosalina sp." /LENGTH=1006 /DNA_ID=CAMNT_0047986941 /DNA_START=80 /DNA_END=3101 /DNA_ORIENTATION=-